MCGIAGIATIEPGVRQDVETIRRMCNAIVHRGPDDEGVYVNSGVGLGMRRLSIIDVSGGHQPIHNEDQTVWVVFNGEIYNFRDLRKELESRGHRFYTNTDTEAIVHLYEDFGSECVHKLRGMFAFAVYDERRRSLLLARDRLGIKPLHYSVSDGTLLFGSEIKAILAAMPELRQVDRRAIREFFYFGYIPDPKTAFANIRKLPPGHILEFAADDPDPKPRRYWDLPEYGASSIASEHECFEEMERRLLDAVRIRLISDVPLGALLSGGTDSSVVVALMAQASSRPVKTFSVAFKHSGFNEGGYAKVVAQKFGTDHQELVVEPDLKETLNRLTTLLEEPFGDSSMLPTYFVCALARQHVTVALSGDGGDELFAGYDRYDVYMRRRRFERIPAWVGKFYRTEIFPRLPVGTRGRKFAYNVTLPSHERYLDSISFITALDDYAPVLSNEFQDFGRNGYDPFDSLRTYLREAKTHDDLSRILYLDTKTYLPADVLTKVDRASMANSLEVRVPILDHLFVEWVTSLPIEFKWQKHNRPKILLKKLAASLGVPSSALNRPKQGFALPLVHWMRNEIREEMARVLLDQRTLQRGYFNRRGIETLLHEHFRARRDHSARLWLLLVFELWHRNFLESLPEPATQTC